MSLYMHIMMDHNHEHLCSPSHQSVVGIYIVSSITSGGGQGEGLGGDGGFEFDRICLVCLHVCASTHRCPSVCKYIMMGHNHEYLCSHSQQSVFVICMICYITSGGGLGEGLGGDGGFVFDWDFLVACMSVLPHTDVRVYVYYDGS